TVGPGSGSLTGTGFHHLVATVDRSGGQLTTYLDGKAVDGASLAGMGSFATANDPVIDFTPNHRFKGRVDEVRVASLVLSSAWIATEYANQSRPDLFLSAGPPL